MADTITRTNTLAIGIQYVDSEAKEKIAYVKIPNPREELQESAIKAAGQKLIDNILLDPEGGEFGTDTKVETAYTEKVTIEELDLGLE